MAVRKVYVTKRASFEAAHHLNNYDGKCSRVHGHSYKLEVTVSGYINPDEISDIDFATEAMVCDFTRLKNIIKKVTDVYDHSDLNYYFDQPTAEVMCVRIYEELKELVDSDCTIECVKLWETEDSYAEYRGE